MTKQGVNPYLPDWEYVPDAEPHVFGDRVYIYGSHDRFGAPFFCVDDYVCWSAPVEDLTDWRCEGVIFKRKQDPSNFTGIRCLFAPDICQGPDGRYYLYYAYDFMGQMGVAVCDTPAGKFEYLGHVRFPDGHYWGGKSGEPLPFDPAILVDDDNRVWLYSGFATKVPAIASRFHNLTNPGGVVIELEQDMLTIKSGPKLIFPLEGYPEEYKGHRFFEASSIRKINGLYYFVYSSENNHDLCYATSDKPDGPFKYGGVLVDIGDVGLDGITDENHARNYLGNTHGGMLKIKDDWYIFYHRQTYKNSYARQACAEKLVVNPDGSIQQAEITSCGLNGGPLVGYGKYDARIACNLWSKEGTGRYDVSGAKRKFKNHPFFTKNVNTYEPKVGQYIANMQDGAVAGFKYFDFENKNQTDTCPTMIKLDVGGEGFGQMIVSTDENFDTEVARIDIDMKQFGMSTFDGQLTKIEGTKPLYFKYQGQGAIDFISFALI
ncbi:MAG: family 43 glycosylhydrolase [Pseudobutyrivibrio sp.]|nr:family 43 glycosylhydrolase [Pseudobutyrivibrio sp.]